MDVEEVLRLAIANHLKVIIRTDPPDGSAPLEMCILPQRLSLSSGNLTYWVVDGGKHTMFTEFISHAEIV